MKEQIQNLEAALAYLILNDAIKGAYWPEEMTAWASEKMRGEQRTGVQLVSEAIGIEY
jgi:hypothetical protein